MDVIVELRWRQRRDCLLLSGRWGGKRIVGNLIKREMATRQKKVKMFDVEAVGEGSVEQVDVVMVM